MRSPEHLLREKVKSEEFWTRTYPITPKRQRTLARLRCRKLADLTRDGLIRRLKRAGFIACDHDPNPHLEAWEVAEVYRPIFQKLMPPEAYVAWRPRSWKAKREARRPEARYIADSFMYMYLRAARGSPVMVTVCFDPLTGILYVLFGELDLSKKPYLVRDVIDTAAELGLVEDC